MQFAPAFNFFATQTTKMTNVPVQPSIDAINRIIAAMAQLYQNHSRYANLTVRFKKTDAAAVLDFSDECHCQVGRCNCRWKEGKAINSVEVFVHTVCHFQYFESCGGGWRRSRWLSSSVSGALTGETWALRVITALNTFNDQDITPIERFRHMCKYMLDPPSDPSAVSICVFQKQQPNQKGVQWTSGDQGWGWVPEASRRVGKRFLEMERCKCSVIDEIVNDSAKFYATEIVVSLNKQSAKDVVRGYVRANNTPLPRYTNRSEEYVCDWHTHTALQPMFCGILGGGNKDLVNSRTIPKSSVSASIARTYRENLLMDKLNSLYIVPASGPAGAGDCLLGAVIAATRIWCQRNNHGIVACGGTTPFLDKTNVIPSPAALRYLMCSAYCALLTSTDCDNEASFVEIARRRDTYDWDNLDPRSVTMARQLREELFGALYGMNLTNLGPHGHLGVLQKILGVPFYTVTGNQILEYNGSMTAVAVNAPGIFDGAENDGDIGGYEPVDGSFALTKVALRWSHNHWQVLCTSDEKETLVPSTVMPLPTASQTSLVAQTYLLANNPDAWVEVLTGPTRCRADTIAEVEDDPDSNGSLLLRQTSEVAFASFREKLQKACQAAGKKMPGSTNRNDPIEI